jgi:hypothetical protein
MTAIAMLVAELKVVCAWCKTTIREAEDPTSKTVSHGICESCSAVHFPERRERAERSA